MVKTDRIAWRVIHKKLHQYGPTTVQFVMVHISNVQAKFYQQLCHSSPETSCIVHKVYSAKSIRNTQIK